MMGLKRYINILKEQPDPLIFLVSYVLWRTHLCKLFKIRLHGITIRFFPTALSASLWVDPSRNAVDFEFIKSYCRGGDVVVDIGANIGTHSLVASKAVGNMGKVFAFEPHPKTYAYCVKNFLLNQVQNIESFNLALGDKEETSLISDDHIDATNKVGRHNLSGIEIAVKTLDSFHFQKIDLLKVDVEGYEKQVFLGAPESLRRTQCVVFESSPNNQRVYGTTTSELIVLLQKAGFEVFHRTGEKILEPLDASYQPTDWEDLYAIRDKKDFVLRTGLSLQEKK